MGAVMAEVPDGLRYTREHEWAKAEAGRVRVGITAFAQAELGDVVFVELPKVGAAVAQMQSFGVVESVKAVSDLFAPIDGSVTEVNDALGSAPELVNQDPYGKGWLILVTPSRPAQLDALMTAQQYTEFIGRS
jgi:glycine cleavage system H protein